MKPNPRQSARPTRTSNPSGRMPDEIMADLDRGIRGVADIDVMDCVWEIIDDILDSVRLADERQTGTETLEVWATVTDYVSTHYGD